MVLSAMEELHRRGRTLVISSHNPEFAFGWADRVAVMKDGRVILDGETREVFGNREILAEAGIDEPFRCRLARELDLPRVPEDQETLVLMLKTKLGRRTT